MRSPEHMLPHYYSSLGPFRETFRTGLPILTYHKLGPRPARVRLKGMYLNQPLFERQLTELKEAGFESVSLSEAANDASAPNRIVLTFDDGFRNVLEHVLEGARARLAQGKSTDKRIRPNGIIQNPSTGSAPSRPPKSSRIPKGIRTQRGCDLSCLNLNLIDLSMGMTSR